MSFSWKYKKLWWKVYKYLEIHTPVKPKKKKYNGKAIKASADTNEYLAKLVRTGEPFCAARIGGSELKAIVSCQPENTNIEEKKYHHNLLYCLSGFCDPYERLDDFSRLMEKSIGDVDLMCVWFNQMEDVIIGRYGARELELGVLEGLEPWYNASNPWTKELAGKKVLVIHPFKDSILKQYEKRAKLFPGTDILPEFELKCVKAVQTLLGEADERARVSWFDALDKMTEEALAQDFDIALIACGAYGLPLAARLKNAGKQAVHVGGALQLLFGIRGKRWDDFELLKPFYSEAWQYPLDSEHLSNSNNSSIENGCYW